MDKQEQALYEMSIIFNEKLCEILQESKKESRHERKCWMVSVICCLVVLFLSILSFIWYLNQYDFSGTIEVDSGSGNAYYQDVKGNEINGEDQSCKETN